MVGEGCFAMSSYASLYLYPVCLMIVCIWYSISQIQDYIVGQGASGAWQYVKYANGLAVAFMNGSFTSWQAQTLPEYPFSYLCEEDVYLPFAMTNKTVVAASRDWTAPIVSALLGHETDTTVRIQLHGSQAVYGGVFSVAVWGWWK